MSMAVVRAAYDHAPILRYVDLSFRHEALRDGLRSLLPSASLLVTVVHPGGLVPVAHHGLIGFDSADFRRNVDLIVTEAERLGRELRFALLCECRQWVSAHQQ
jgi:hypothetical protein